VWRDAEREVQAAGSVRYSDDVWSVARCTELAANPVVLAGQLPPGAVGVIGVDRDMVVANGYWICKTRLRALRREPEIAYRDVDGDVFQRQTVPPTLRRVQPAPVGNVSARAPVSSRGQSGSDFARVQGRVSGV
jgi:hypothetical protein